MTLMRSEAERDKEEIEELKRKLETINLQKSSAGNMLDARAMEDLIRDAAFRFGQQLAMQLPGRGNGRESYSGQYQRSQQSSSASQSNYSMSSYRTMNRGL